MCVIAVSRKGIRQPTKTQLYTMWRNNPHGAGYMVARDGEVVIHKGFMVWDDFYRAVREEHFTTADSVVYHFRIATQGGINPKMTHPFPLSRGIEYITALGVKCPIGLAHNGIIRMTAGYQETYSDTALFIMRYMPKLIRKAGDEGDEVIREIIEDLTGSKWAIMNGRGEIYTVGHFIEQKGLLFSNMSFLQRGV